MDYELATEIIPTAADCTKIIKAKLQYNYAYGTLDKAAANAWAKEHFDKTPWGICVEVSDKANPKPELALKYFLIAIIIDWTGLSSRLKTVLKKWHITAEGMREVLKTYWVPNLAKIINTCKSTGLVEQLDLKKVENLVEAVEKHNTLNSKLFTKEEILKDKVRDKMLEIVDEFLADLKEQDIKVKVEDILLIGSNASYNYNKDSDIDLHILTNTKATNYSPEVAGALYSAYRSLFNKNLDIEFFGIPLEIFVETEDSARVSNGIYSVKKNKWIKKPVPEEIPDYDKDVLDGLVAKWEDKCKGLIDDIKADKLKDEKKVVKLLEDIYEKLRKKGIAKGEYSIENLAFKELRNKGYLDQLKDYKHELISKRLSLEEKFDRQTRLDVYNQIARAAGTPPIIQDNGMFFIYNIKPSEINSRVRAIKQLPCIVEVHAYENGKYDFSNVLDIALNKIPSKYYDIRGMININ